MSKDTPQQRTGTPTVGCDCTEIEGLLAPVVEGVLELNATVRVMNHVRGCRRCEALLQEFRRFVIEEPTVPTPDKARPSAVPPVPSSPYREQWLDRLQRWLDVIFPGTVMAPVYRGTEDPPSDSAWELAARQQSEQPFATLEASDIQVVLHLARGVLFGRLSHSSGEPVYPALISLVGDDIQESALNLPDGTFQLRWDPDASRLECQTPLGAVYRFDLPAHH